MVKHFAYALEDVILYNRSIYSIDECFWRLPTQVGRTYFCQGRKIFGDG